MQSLYELTKKIDALTANSMQVLNALVRSCIAGGSSRGYTVSKYGVTVEMTRADIYRLYDFYQDWERHGFTADGFQALLDKADERWYNSKQGANGDTGRKLATEAVAKHAKILYLDSTNNKNTADEYWVNKIKESAEQSGEVAKATVSSAPIPLNLRTPLYDENLSVKSFTQYETYLFPIGYQRSMLLGVPGNGESYLAGGKNWTIEVSDYLSLRGKHTVFGKVSNPVNRVDNYFYVMSDGTVGDESSNTISGGYESYALRDNSGAFGFRSISLAPNAFAFGNGSIAYGADSFVAGGRNCTTLGPATFSTGIDCLSSGESAFTANRRTATTGAAYQFVLESIENSQDVVTTECREIFDESRGECVVPDSAAAVAALSNARTIVIPDDFVASTGDTELDIRIGDQVIVYDHRRLSGGAYIDHNLEAGYTFPTLKTIVTGVRHDDAGTRYLVELSGPIQLSATVNGNTYGTVVSGKIAVVARNISARDADGTYLNPANVLLGTDSSAFGYATRAPGMAQMVVGAHNAVNYYARFTVGCGSAYINAGKLHDGLEEGHRTNGMVVSPFYSYMREVNGTGVAGVGSADYTGDDSDQVAIRKGAFLSSTDGEISSIVNARPDKAVAYASSGNDAHGYLALGTTDKPVVSNGWEATAHMMARKGIAIVSAGAYISAGVPLVESLLEESNVIGSTDTGVGVYSKGGIEIRCLGSKGMHIGASAYISMAFAGITMKGETYGTLAASCKSRDHILCYEEGEPASHRDGIETLYALCHSGFYYGWMGRKNLSFNQSEVGQTFDAWHIVSSAAAVDSTENDVSALLLPAEVKGTYYPHPRVVNFRNDGSYQSTSVLAMNEALAFYKDCLFSSGTIHSANTATMTLSKTGAEDDIEISGDMVVGTDNRSSADATLSNDTGFASGTLSLRNVVYTLNGNCLSMSMKLTSNVQVNLLPGITTFQYKCTIPMILGLNVVQQKDYRFPKFFGVSYTHIPLSTDFDYMGEEVKDVTGYALATADGRVEIHLTNLYTKSGENDVINISFTGPVPFYAAADSLGMNINPDTRVD